MKQKKIKKIIKYTINNILNKFNLYILFQELNIFLLKFF